jgi:hypothetical protein
VTVGTKPNARQTPRSGTSFGDAVDEEGAGAADRMAAAHCSQKYFPWALLYRRRLPSSTLHCAQVLGFSVVARLDMFNPLRCQILWSQAIDSPTTRIGIRFNWDRKRVRLMLGPRSYKNQVVLAIMFGKNLLDWDTPFGYSRQRTGSRHGGSSGLSTLRRAGS